MKRLFYLSFTSICLLFLFQSTAEAQINLNKKDRKKKPASSTSGISKGLQDLTTRYNRYFNSKLLFDDGLRNLVQNNEESFDEVLSVYPYKPGPDASTLHPNMDQIVEKTSYAVTYKPNSKWVDDCYLIMGKAYFMKGEYQTAIKSFKYINANYKTKKRKSGKISTPKSKAKKAKKSSAASKQSKASAQAKNKEKQIAAKEREKERAIKAKERAKTQKEKAKARKKKAKARKKAIKQKKKRAEANRKARKKGKPLPYPKKDPVETETAEEEEPKEEVEPAPEPVQEIVEEEEEVVEEEEEVVEEEIEEEVDIDDIKVDKTYRDGGFLKHKLAAPEANIWLARAYIEDEQYTKAKALIDKAINNRKFPKRLQGELNALAAHYHLMKGDDAEAKKSLKYAIKTTRKKKQRARYYYILGQLQEKDSNHGDAVKSYAGVIKSKPTFDMELNARIQIAKAKMQSGEYSADQAITYLKKLTKDDKYIDHKDKLNYVMGEIALANGDTEEAFAYLKDAAASSTVNQNQKALAYLRIAEMLYEDEDYLMASAYYDSTLTYLPKTYDQYEEVTDRKSLLEKLALNFAVIQREDSLLRIARMPDAKRRVYLEEIIEQLQQQAQDDSFRPLEQNTGVTQQNRGSGWYFYNAASKAMGYNDFQAQWGARKNIDNWRTERDDFSMTSPGLDSSTLADAQADQFEIDSLARAGNLTVAALESKLPLDKASKDTANERIALAHFEMGNIYGNRLDNREKAIYYFDRLLERYPKTPYSPQTHYNLYLLHKEEEPSMADQHKRVILDDYPESVYAKMLRGESSYADQQDDELEEYYTQTYVYFQNENFEEVLRRKSDVNNQFSDNYLAPKFDMLEAYVIGKTENRDAYITALNGIVNKYPDDEVKVKAEEILSYLGGKPSGDSKTPSKYKHKPNSKHYFIIAMDGFSTQISSVQNELSNLNQSDFSLDKLKVNQMLLDKDNQIVIVKDFKNAEKGMAYYNKVTASKDKLLKDLDVTYQYFVISKLNFSQFFKEKDADSYYNFFIENFEL